MSERSDALKAAMAIMLQVDSRTRGGRTRGGSLPEIRLQVAQAYALVAIADALETMLEERQS